MLWASTGWARGWLKCSFCWPAERKALSSVQKGKLLVLCEDLSPTKTCPSHRYHMNLVCRWHHNSSDPLRAELLLPVPSCPKALTASVAFSVDVPVNRGRPQSECSSWLPRNSTAIHYWLWQLRATMWEIICSTFMNFLEKVQHTGSLTQCSQTHWNKSLQDFLALGDF